MVLAQHRSFAKVPVRTSPRTLRLEIAGAVLPDMPLRKQLAADSEPERSDQMTSRALVGSPVIRIIVCWVYIRALDFGKLPYTWALLGLLCPKL